MNKIILMALLFVPCFAMAQSEWESPETVKTKESVKKTDKVLDPKYAAGAVPEIDGKVVWEKTIEVPGTGVDEVFERTLAAIRDISQEPKQRENSRVSAINKQEHIIAATFIEEMVFSTRFLGKDFTDCKYTLIATCHEGSVNLKFCRISYEYEKGRHAESKYTAEEWITDKECINQKGTRLYPANGKFRKKTIDRKDEVFSYIESKLK